VTKETRPRRLSEPEAHAAMMLQRHCPGGAVLDLPCGRGRLARHLGELGYNVTAADISPDAFQLEDVACHEADLDGRIKFPDAAFDAVCCVAGLEHVENPYHTLREFRRVLKPAGYLVLQVPNFSSLLRRLRFLVSGHLAKARPRASHDGEAKADRGHITCLTFAQVRHVLATTLFELVDAHYFHFQHRTALFAFPVWGPVMLFGRAAAALSRKAPLTGGMRTDVLFNRQALFLARKGDGPTTASDQARGTATNSGGIRDLG